MPDLCLQFGFLKCPGGDMIKLNPMATARVPAAVLLSGAEALIKESGPVKNGGMIQSMTYH